VTDGYLRAIARSHREASVRDEALDQLRRREARLGGAPAAPDPHELPTDPDPDPDS
jgi:hypothetical protein